MNFLRLKAWFLPCWVYPNVFDSKRQRKQKRKEKDVKHAEVRELCEIDTNNITSIIRLRMHLMY
jgi:hypothetical protein